LDKLFLDKLFLDKLFLDKLFLDKLFLDKLIANPSSPISILVHRNMAISKKKVGKAAVELGSSPTRRQLGRESLAGSYK